MSAVVHSLTADQVIQRLDGDRRRGLTSAEAAARLDRWGPNQLQPAATRSPWLRLLGQFADPVVYLLMVAIVVSGVVWVADGADGLPLDSLVIAVIVIVNAVVGFVQEHKAEAALAALQVLTGNEATVIRDGQPGRVPASQLVPGDVVLLADGDVVPADLRLVEVTGLQIAEAAITGESAPVDKSVAPVADDTPLGDREGMAFGGTAVIRGRATAMVTATGTATEVGKIATLLDSTTSDETPLQREIDRVGRILGVGVVAIAVIVVIVLIVVGGLRTASELVDALLIGLSLAVAAVPEGLPAVLTVVLALGVQRMSERNALVKRLVSVEALGSATVICSDKTGTLTRNEMMVRRLVVPSGEARFSGAGYGPYGEVVMSDHGNGEHDGRPTGGTALQDRAGQMTGGPVEDEVRFALTAAVLASDASITSTAGRFDAVGDPTEAALLAAATKLDIDYHLYRARFVRVAEIPFTSERKRMSSVHTDTTNRDELRLMVKGAPDILVPRCRADRQGENIVAMTEQRRNWWLSVADELAGQALRTLAIAYRPMTAPHHKPGAANPGGPAPNSTALDNTALDNTALDEMALDDTDEDDLILLGVFGIIDPPRREAAEAISRASAAGIRVAMITGDHPTTAAMIAAELGVIKHDDPVITGAAIAAMSDEELADAVSTCSVYARVAPEHKLRIVKALAAGDEVVAMTGDGVNDAPALKAASIGIAMGVTGSDVSKEAADMILTDDNFATIVDAVNEGRAIFHNIRSFLRYLLSSNAGEVLTVFLGVIGAGLLGLSVGEDGIAAPLLAVHILWINLVTDAAPALALGVDPPLPGLMERNPRRLSDRVIDRRMQLGVALIGLTMAIATLSMLDVMLPGGLVDGDHDLTTARTGAFTVLVLAQLFNTVNARSDTESAIGHLLANRWLVAAIGFSLALQVAVVHLPALSEPFKVSPLSLGDWVLATVLASSVFWVSEIRKYRLRLRTDARELD